MKLAPANPFNPSARRLHRSGGFTVLEFMIATLIVILLVSGFVMFTDATGRTMVNVTTQSSHNQTAGHAAEMILRRIRLANTASNAVSGDTLTLSFDDDPDTDSNGDGVAWNDRDRFEQFQFVDTNLTNTSPEYNTLVYTTNTSGGASQTIVPGGVRPFAGVKIFQVTNVSTVLINFGLFATNISPSSQSVEVRTQARLRNKIN